MLTRRALLAFSLSAALLAGTPLARAQGASGDTAFIVNLGNQMAAIVNGPGSLAQKQTELRPLVERSVDVENIARFCLGRFWRIATPAQQQRFGQLFHKVLLNNISSKLGEFQGVSFTPTTTTQREGESFVGTLIRRPNQEPNTVQWVVSDSTGSPKIIDVIAEGTSLRLTQRADYASYLSRNNNNIDALLAAMEKQVSP